MQIAIIENDQVVRFGVLGDLFPNVTFPPAGPDDVWLTENSAMRVQNERAYDLATERLVGCDPYLDNGKVFNVRIEQKTEWELDQQQQSKINQIRARRNQLLASSDWTQVADAPVDQAAWAVYRQALRDITAQPGFPNEIAWPEAPAT